MSAWRMAQRSVPKDGERANGDAVVLRQEQGRTNGDAVVLRQEQGRTLVAVIDGLGHGEAAAVASARASAFLATMSLSGELERGMQGLHEALRGTRGAAATVCLLHGPTIVCCGVGNVELRCFGSKLPMLLSPGVLGARVQKFRMCRAELAVDSRLVLFSDGISQRSPLETMRHLTVEDLCEAVIREHRKPSDDATVVACDLKV